MRKLCIYSQFVELITASGHGAANVTLGIPRLREIIMTASVKPKTPLMHLPLQDGVDVAEVDRFCKASNRLTLSQLVENVTVTEELVVDDSDSRAKHFLVRIKFYDLEECKEAYVVKAKDIERALTGAFAAQFRKEITGELKKLAAQWKSLLADIDQGQAVRETRAREGDGDDEMADAPPRRDDDDSDAGDADADEVKRSRQTKQMATYDDDSSDSDEEEAPPVQEDGEAAEATEPAPVTGEQAFLDKLGGIATSFTYSKNNSECRFELLVRASHSCTFAC